MLRALEELRERLDKKWRNQLSSSEKKDLKVMAGTGDDEYRTFCLIYDQMRKRKTFETTVDVEEFGRIQQDLPECSSHADPDLRGPRCSSSGTGGLGDG